MTTLAAPNSAILRGVGLMIGFCIFAPLLDVCAKLAAQSIPVGQITTARFVGQMVLMLPICAAWGLPLRTPPGSRGLIMLRALFLILSTYFFNGALRFMPLADALAIAFVEPFIILIAARYLFDEDVGPRRLSACAVGFIGVLFVIQPSFTAFGAIALFPLGTALSFAAYILVTRQLAARIHPVAMQYYTATAATMICVPLMLIANGRGWSTLDPVLPVGIDWLWLLGVGFFASVSHLMMTYALRYAPSSVLAPLHYLEIVTATFLGYVIFHDFPNQLSLIGILIVVGSGLYIIHRERVAARQT